MLHDYRFIKLIYLFMLSRSTKRCLLVLVNIFVLLSVVNFCLWFCKCNRSHRLNLTEVWSKSLNETLHHVEEPYCDVIHIFTVCVGSKANRQVVTLVKSVLFYRKNALHFHFVVDDDSKLTLSHLFQTWDIPDFTVSFYFVFDHVDKIAWIANRHYSGIYGLIKIIVPDILPNQIKKVIILDADVVLKSDIANLWNHFSLFSGKEAIGLVENQSDWYLGTLWLKYKPWPALGRGFNTGVILMDCFRLKKMEWSKKWQYLAKTGINKFGSTNLADQDIINSVIKKYSFLVYILPCKWNVQLSDNVRAELCYAKCYNQIGIVHWNNRKKLTVKQNNLQSLQNIFLLFDEMSGDLLKIPVVNCRKGFFDSDKISRTSESCQEFEESFVAMHRIHLYYLPFEYKSNGRGDVTIAVQFSVDRLPMFETICKFWQGPVSAAIYVSDFFALHVFNFVQSSNVLRGRKNIGYHFVYSTPNERVYPINFLRNVALENIHTEYVFLCDVDFAPMPSLYDYIVSHVSTTEVSNKSAFIIAAFESFLYNFLMPTTKSELILALEKGSITTFRSYVWPQGHKATNYTSWINAKVPYSVAWQSDFEPYLVVRKYGCPMYDRRFSGFGWNKISHVMELNAAGFHFSVLPFGFIVHLPHAPSNDLSKYRSLPSYRHCLELAITSFKIDLQKKYSTNTTANMI